MSGTRELVEVYPISTINLPELRDPNDNMILGTAIAADADAIVTGDLDLLVLQEYEGIPIATAREFFGALFSRKLGGDRTCSDSVILEENDRELAGKKSCQLSPI